jgi:2'-5' RNA ligase
VSVRLFVALDLPPEARSALARFRDAAADPAVWRPVGDDALHLTLAFLGHRPEEDVDVAGGLIDELPAAAPRLRLAGALLLPPRRARVLCAAVEDQEGVLAALQAAAAAALAGAGLYIPERRPFRPHATVARLRSGARAPAAVPGAPDPLAFAGAAVTLYRSHLERGGARYEPLARRRLVPAPSRASLRRADG